MFGMPENPALNNVDPEFMGDPIRGFGFLHDGGHDTRFHVLHAGPDRGPLPWRCPGLRGCRAG